jgi:hypothetical protein
VVRAEDDCGLGKKTHVQEVVDSNPAVYWMDVSDASLAIITYTLIRKRIKVAK